MKHVPDREVGFGAVNLPLRWTILIDPKPGSSNETIVSRTLEYPKN